MITKYSNFSFLLIILIILQLTVIEFFSFENIKPEIVLIGLIIFTLRYGQNPGMIAAFFAGIALDLIGNGVLGANSLSKVIATFIAGYFSNPNSDRLIYDSSFFGIILLSAIIDKIIYIFITINVEFKSLLIVMINYGLVPAIITLIFSLFVLIFPTKSEIR